jgi:sterol desaturase/sphingolipid hydroxylase (fatty acid hydroxylase superfamily)
MILENLWYITKQTLSLFASSITSSYLICLVTNYPFYNPKLTFVQLMYTIADSSFNLGIIGLEIIGSAYLYYPYMHLENHSMITSVFNIIQYSFWIEIFYYFYHRFLHLSSWYTFIHEKHHSNLEVYPLDTLNISVLDSTGMIITLIAPLFSRILFYNVSLLNRCIFNTFAFICFSTCCTS